MAVPKRESIKKKKERAQYILGALETLFPAAKTELDHTNAFELLIATTLSAQATDVSVNKATPALFKKYPTPEKLAKAKLGDVEDKIKTIGLYRTKAKNIVALSQILVRDFGGEVPQDSKTLQTLPGVGWKTATVVLGSAFGIPGIAVDTHLIRLASRLNLSGETSPEKIGSDLQKLFPQERWVFVHHGLILFGRYSCIARNPKCSGCILAEYCASRGAW